MRGLSTEEYKALLRSVGTHRGDRPLSPLEVACLLKKSMAAGSTRQECAKDLQLGSTQVATFLKLLDLAPEIQHLADWRGSTSASISFSALAELARLCRPDQIEAANGILLHRLTWKEVVQLVQLADRSAKPMSQCIDQVLKLRPQVEIRHLFIGAITSGGAKRHVESLSQRKRDQLFAHALEELLGAKDIVSGRLGTNNFTILSDQDLPKLLNLNPDELEEALNEVLEQARTTT